MNHISLSGGGYWSGGRTNKMVIYDGDTFSLQSAMDPSIVFKLDTAGNLLCGSIIGTGGDDNNSVVCSPNGEFVYLGGDILDTITLGNNFLEETAGENPFIARWQPCCSAPVALTGNSSFCKGSKEVLRISGGGNYSWNTGSTNDSIIINPDTATTYSVSIENGGCVYILSKTIGVNPLPSVNVCCDSIITNGQSVQLVSSGGASYSWFPDIGLSCDTCSDPLATPSQTTTYTLTVTNDSGCVTSKYITIDVSCGEVFVPEIFSPNQNVNNILYVRGPCISALDFMIFDRWGNKIFETKNLNQGWDGTFKGQPMNTGTYMYYAKATLFDGSVVEKKGAVTLVR